MKKTLKLTSLLFTLILAVSVVFTGCGNGRKDSTTKGTTENNNASGTTEDNLVDDAEDAVDDVADGVGDAVDDIANGFDNYDDAHEFASKMQNSLKTIKMVSMKFEMRQKTNRNTGMEPVDIILKSMIHPMILGRNTEISM